jgi:putative hydrolase of the HAD superfamily
VRVKGRNSYERFVVVGAVSERNARVGVTLDLWETLIFDKPELDETRGRMRCEGIQHALERLGISVALVDVERGYEESGSKLQEVWDKNVEVSTLEQILLIVELGGGEVARIPTSPEATQPLITGYVEPILTLPPPLGEDVVSTLEDLRTLGSKIGLISNTGRGPGEALRRLLQNYGVMKYFDATTFSNEVGCRKPDPRIFKQTVDELGMDPSQVIHVGDNPVADFEGARLAGMKAVLFEPELLNSTEWGPDSLFALSRRHQHSFGAAVETDLRIKSLRAVPSFVKRLMDAAG